MMEFRTKAKREIEDLRLRLIDNINRNRLIWLAPLSLVIFTTVVARFFRFNNTAANWLKQFAINPPSFIDSAYSYIFFLIAAVVALILYFFVDYQQHYKPLKQEMPDVAYNPIHHAKVVIIPRAYYRWKASVYWLSYGMTSLIVISFIVALQIQPALAYAPDEFVTTWKTDNPGTSSSTQITIPTTGGGYNYDIDWGDGNTDVGQTGNITHTYASAGTYEVKITGTFPRIYFNNGGDRRKILTIEQWGTNAWTSMESSFMGASNLQINAVDAPDLSGVTDLEQMFAFATNFNSNIYNWNVSTITNMNSMFYNATYFNKPLNSWDTSSLTSMSALFFGADSYNKPLSNWNVSGVSDFSAVFNSADNFNQSLSGWDISNATDMSIFLSGTSMSSTNYDETLIAWSGLTLQNGVTLMASGISYCSTGATTARSNIISTYSWTIMDGGQDCGDQAFVTTWDTSSTGYQSTDDDQIEIPAATSGTYNYDVDWGDGNTDTGVTGKITHTYASPGTYTVSITGDFPRIHCATSNSWECYHKLLTVEQWGDIEWSSMQEAFYSAQHLEINATDAPDLSNVTNMTSMFSNASSMNSDISHWDVSNVTNMNLLFTGASSFNQPLNNWDVSSVTEMASMFSSTPFDQNINNWDTSNVTNMNSMFNSATSFNQPLDSWDVSSVTSMSGMFRNADSFNQDISSWDVSSVTSMTEMFKNNDAYNQDMTNWNTSSVTSTVDMFSRSSVFNGDLSNWQTGSLVDMTYMFYDAIAYNQPMNNWDVGSVTDMDYVFQGATSFNQPLDNWDTSSVEKMNGMFSLATSFNQPINSWNTGSVWTMGGMFNGASAFNQPLDNWDTADVISMGSMFASTPFNQDISSWNTGSVTSMVSMFYENTSFNQPLNNWDVSQVYGMSYMFQGATSFNQPLDSWDTSGLDNTHLALRRMFQDATSFNQDISTWDLNGVTRFDEMFNGATSFDQDLGDWDMSTITYAANAFANSGMSTQNYDATLIGWHDQDLEDTVSLGSSSFYCISANERQSMIDDHSWIISDSGEDCGEYDPPSVTTSTPSGITDEQATLNADITADGGASITNAGFEWGETTSYGTNISGLAGDIGTFNTTVALADCGQEYHYRAYASNPIGTTYGSDQTFTSDTCFREAVTKTPEEVDSSTVVFKGAVTGEAADDFVDGGFEWGKTASYGNIKDGLTISGNNFSSTVTNIDCDTQYHYRAFATDDEDTIYNGANKTFTIACPNDADKNSAPVTTITAPIDGQIFAKNSVVSLGADAADSDGTITEVRFYVNGVLIGTDLEEPYVLTGDASIPGVYELVVVAEDNDGAETSSEPVGFIVTTTEDEDAKEVSDEEKNIDGDDEPGIIVTPDEDDIYPDGKRQETKSYILTGAPAIVGQSAPWIVLIFLALGYFIQAYRQARQNRILQASLKIAKQTQENLGGFLDIVSHYLGTAATAIAGAVELLTSKPGNTSPATVSRLGEEANKLKLDLNSMIASLQSDAETVVAGPNGSMALDEQSVNKWVIMPSAIASVVLIIGLFGLSNAGLWQTSNGLIIFSVTVLASTIALLFVSFRVWQHQQQLQRQLQSAISEQQQVLDSKRKFINENQPKLKESVTSIEKTENQVTEPTFRKLFDSGLARLKHVADAFSSIASLNSTANVQSVIPANDLLTSQLGNYIEQAEQKGVNIKTDIQKKLISPLQPEELQRVITTLMDNSIIFTPEGGAVLVSATNTKNTFSLTVSDNGAGIAKDKLNTLMQPFARGTSTSEYNYEGLGLSLYTTRLIAEKYGGTVNIESTGEGKGTKVTFTSKV